LQTTTTTLHSKNANAASVSVCCRYAAFYRWIQEDFHANAVLHFGMHGTVEWLPGAPLGNSGFSWSDMLLGELPNAYVYACNNPSVS
jgi:magnesium chelatase subunit H